MTKYRIYGQYYYKPQKIHNYIGHTFTDLDTAEREFRLWGAQYSGPDYDSVRMTLEMIVDGLAVVELRRIAMD